MSLLISRAGAIASQRSANWVRDFDGVDDCIRVTVPSYFDQTNNATYVAVVKRDTPGVDWEGIFSICQKPPNESSNPFLTWEFGSNISTSGIEIVGNASRHGFDQHATNWNYSGWQIVAVSVSSSSTVARFHRFDGTSWYHANTSGSAGGAAFGGSFGNWDTTGSGANLVFGCWNSSFNFIDGKFATQAWWIGTALNDTQIEALAGGNRASWAAAGASHLWEFNQASISTGITDFIGSCHEISKVGTAVITANFPTSNIYRFTP